MQAAVGTCNLACWMAREDVCRCMCEGENHGIMRDGEGEQPGRYCQRKGVQYELDQIHLSYWDADKAARVSRQEYNEAHDLPFYTESSAFQQRATGHMLKWPEVESTLRFMSFVPGLRAEAYLVWVRKEA